MTMENKNKYLSSTVIIKELLIDIIKDIFTNNKRSNEIRISMKKDLDYIEKELKDKDRYMKEYNLEELCEVSKLNNRESEDSYYDDPFYSKLSRAERRAYERNLRKNKNKRNRNNKENK